LKKFDKYRSSSFCRELWVRGLLPTNMYGYDKAFAEYIKTPAGEEAYRSFAKPFVHLMQNSLVASVFFGVLVSPLIIFNTLMGLILRLKPIYVTKKSLDYLWCEYGVDK